MQPASDKSRSPEARADNRPYKIPKKSNSAVWAKNIRPEELQDDEIFDELERYKIVKIINLFAIILF